MSAPAFSPESAGSLRDEIIASQEARTGYLKWKIFLIAGLGIAGFGLYRSNGRTFPAALGLIPLVCTYVDALCIHNDIRMLVIAKYLKNGIKGNRKLAHLHANNTNNGVRVGPPDPYIAAYEEWCGISRWMFSLETTALLWTSLLVSGLVFATTKPGVWESITGSSDNIQDSLKTWLVAASTIGAIASVALYILKKLIIKHCLNKDWSPSS